MCRYSLNKNIFFTILLLYFTRLIQSEVTKCCSEKLVLDIEKHSCEFSANQTEWDAYNLPTLLVSNCSVPRSVFKGSKSYIELNGCIDKDKNDQYVAVSCSKNVHSNTGVHLINKCCPIGLSYDHIGRFCAQNPETHGHFKKLFGNTAVVFKNEVPDCSEDEVFVEYFSTVHDIEFNGKNLKVCDKILSSDKFCIEDLVNIHPNEGKNEEKYFIIRSCRPRSICGKIPCIRRCCKTDQIMTPQPKGKRECHFHPNKKNLVPVFHDISFPLDSDQKEVHLTGIILDSFLLS